MHIYICVCVCVCVCVCALRNCFDSPLVHVYELTIRVKT